MCQVYNYQKALIPPLVKVRDVATLLSVSRSTVRNLIDSGELEGSRINPCEKRRNHLRVTRSSLLVFYQKRFGHSLTRALANPFEP
jgi:excisionase family DNA binding protein